MTIWPQTKPDPHRKIHLDPSQFKPYSERAQGGDARCDHDWEGEGGSWTCALCGRTQTYEPYA